jgi:threonine/homoserine/homoserine lactone efflux protein
MITAFLAGAAAGLGIAIPVGAIAILIVETGLRRGFRLAAAAGAGAASVDGLYALVAAAFGAALAAVLAPWEKPLRVVAVVVLVAIAVRGFIGLRALSRAAARPSAPMASSSRSPS